MDHFTALNINQKVEMLKEVCSEERDGYWCKLEVPSIYLGAGVAKETKRDDVRTAAYHRRTIRHQKMHSVNG